MEAMTLLAAAVVGTLAVARATRLVTADAYPPAVALRRWWFNVTVAKGGWRKGWAPLLTDDEAGHGCPFCAAPYAAAVSLAWALASGAHLRATVDLTTWAGWWWVLSTWCAVSYLAAMIVVRDEPPAEED